MLDKEIYLQAVLAEYKALKDEVSVWIRSYPIILSVWIGGVATLFGFSKAIGGLVTLLVIPIFTSLCAIVVVGITFATTCIGIYIKKEIERKKLQKIFPATCLPFAWEGYSERHGRFWQFFLMGLVVLISFLSFGCLGIVSYAHWSEVTTDTFLLLTFILGWLLTIFFPILSLFFTLEARSLEHSD